MNASAPAGRRPPRRDRPRPDLRSRSALAGEAAAAAAEVESSLQMPPDPQVAAFFDVDNTIMQGASIFHLARGGRGLAGQGRAAAQVGARLVASRGPSPGRCWGVHTATLVGRSGPPAVRDSPL